MIRTWALCCALVVPALLPGQEAKLNRPTITGISHMTLYADDFAKSQQFYGSLLGWKETPAGPAQSGVRFYANHAQYIQLLSPPSQGLANRFDSIGFSTSDAEALRQFLAANGITVPKAVTVEPDRSRSFLTRDPEGNKVEFTQAGLHPPKAGESAAARVSTHIIHAGFVAHDRAALDRFYKDLLGFHLYWQGGAKADQTDWVMMQVPDGADWLEYMLNLPANPSRREMASANHFSPGVVSVAELDRKLKQRGWVPSANERPPLLGLDGKWQLDLYDPDGTRAEFMEFKTVKEPCCSSFTGTQPEPSPTW
jgi:catechol 2,3-dioxygenase-like lactoylglutathione lyase family enzyme